RAALPLALVALDLAVHLVDHNVDSGEQVRRALLGTQNRAARVAERHLRHMPVTIAVRLLLRQLHLNVHNVGHVAVQASHLALDVRLQTGSDIYIVSADDDLHLLLLPASRSRLSTAFPLNETVRTLPLLTLL